MSWIIWALLLLAQNAAFTWVSRARNSGSLQYHAVAAIGSNGIYFLNLVVSINKLTGAKTLTEMIVVGSFYTLFTVIGSVSMHHFLMTRVEKGARKVGA